MHDRRSNPVGVFDSGIGGLTVLREITRLLPDEDTVYLGDTARVPYGSKSKETIVRYSLEVARFLVKRNVKMIVAACNTASAFAIAELDKALDIPVIGVINPGAKSAAGMTRTGRIGVIGTEGTIRSNAYCKAIKAINPRAETFTMACPLFVPLVEEGWADEEVTATIARNYLSGLKDSGIDTLVLGCTHYPLLKKTIASIMGPDIALVDSAESTAEEVKRVLGMSGMLNVGQSGGATHRFYVTDSPERFMAVGVRFFGSGLSGAELADLNG